MGKRVGACVIAVVVAGAVASGSGAGSGTIVPGVSLAGVGVGQSAGTVRATFGAPPVKRVGSAGSETVRWEYADHNNLVITFTRGKVAAVMVSADKGDQIIDRTGDGFGLLTSVATMAKVYRRNCGFEPGFFPLCRWTTDRGDMIFRVTGDYGDGPNAPIQVIELSRPQ